MLFLVVREAGLAPPCLSTRPVGASAAGGYRLPQIPLRA